MAARTRGPLAAGQPTPEQRAYTVSGTGPGGQTITLTVDAASDAADAVYQARKRAALTGMTAEAVTPDEATPPTVAGPDPADDLTGCVEVPEGANIADFIQSQRSAS